MKKIVLCIFLLTFFIGVANAGPQTTVFVSSGAAAAGGHSKSDANLMGLWYFEDDLEDETANNNDLAAVGTLSYAAHELNDSQTKSVLFEDNESASSDDTDLDPDTDFSAGGWFYPSAEDVYYGIFGKHDADGEYGWVVVLRGDVANDPIRFYCSDDGSTWETAFSTTCGGDCFAANNWIHVVLVHNGASNEVRLYINGSEINADDFPASYSDGVFNANTKFKVATAGTDTNDFIGNADECFYFKGKALNDEEVANIHTNGFSD